MFLNNYRFDFCHWALHGRLYTYIKPFSWRKKKYWFWFLHQNPYNLKVRESDFTIDMSLYSYSFFSITPSLISFIKAWIQKPTLGNWDNWFKLHSICSLQKVKSVIFIDLSRYSKSYVSVTTGLISSRQTSVEQSILVQENSIGKLVSVFLEWDFW